MRIVVAVDGSKTSLHALSALLRLAKEFAQKPDLHAIAVVDYFDIPDGLGKAPAGAPDLLASEAETALAAATELAGEMGFPLHTEQRRGHVVGTVLAFAREIGADLIVTGTHGRKGLQRAVVGSSCEGLIRASDVPVFAVRLP